MYLLKRLFCNNNFWCSFLNVIGSGEVAEIALRHVEGGTSVPVLGETFDQSAERMVVFTEAYPGVVYKKEVEIQNRVYVSSIFSWLQFLKFIFYLIIDNI